MRAAVIPPPRGRLTPAKGRIATFCGDTMGTYWTVRMVGAPPDGLVGEIEGTLGALVAQMSQWDPASEISAYNRAAPGEWVAISADFAAVMHCALELAAMTDGAFDPALGAAVDAWGFGAAPAPDAAPTEPGAWRAVRLEARGLFQPGGVRLDLSGIAKGYAVDRIARLLADRGVEAFLVEIGGELFGQGLKADGSPWWAQVEAPRDGWDEEMFIALPGWAIATSGDYRRHVDRDGRRYSHTFDPALGAPLAEPPASVTVLAKDCMRADAWATALTVMGETRGLAFADAHHLAALFLMARPTGVEARPSAAWTRLQA